MDIFSLIFSTENMRMLILIVFGYAAITRLKTSLELSLGSRIDRVEKRIDAIEASLNARIDAIEASLNARIDAVEASLNARIDAIELSLNTKIDGVESSLIRLIDEKIDSKLEAFHTKLKQNDFAHLNNTIEALTFTLKKNKFLSIEDKSYIDSRLDK